MTADLKNFIVQLRESRKPTDESAKRVMVEAQVDEETAAWLSSLANEINVDRSELIGAALTEGLKPLRKADRQPTGFLHNATATICGVLQKMKEHKEARELAKQEQETETTEAAEPASAS